MDEAVVETDSPTVGELLREARKRKKLSLEDIAAQTRIPLRHLESLENSDWEHLPAPTYSIGFAKSYAAAVGLDRQEIGDKLRVEMGGTALAASTPAEVFEPADPARTMPKWLVIGAILGVILLVLGMRWLSDRQLYGSDEEAVTNAPAPVAPAPAPAPVAQGPVLLSASEPVWMSVYDKAGTKYFEGMLNPGTSFTVPTSAPAPLLKTGKPEALKIMVGPTQAPPIGEPGKMVSDVSLLSVDLLKGGGAAAPATPPAMVAPAPAPAQPPARSSPPPRRKAVRPAPAPAPPPPEPATQTVPVPQPTPTNTSQ